MNIRLFLGNDLIVFRKGEKRSGWSKKRDSGMVGGEDFHTIIWGLIFQSLVFVVIMTRQYETHFGSEIDLRQCSCGPVGLSYFNLCLSRFPTTAYTLYYSCSHVVTPILWHYMLWSVDCVCLQLQVLSLLSIQWRWWYFDFNNKGFKLIIRA